MIFVQCASFFVVFVCPKSVIDKMAEFKPFSATIHQLQFSKMVLIIPHIFLHIRIFPCLNQNKPFHSRGWTMSSINCPQKTIWDFHGISQMFTDFHRCFIRPFPMVLPWENPWLSTHQVSSIPSKQEVKEPGMAMGRPWVRYPNVGCCSMGKTMGKAMGKPWDFSLVSWYFWGIPRVSISSMAKQKGGVIPLEWKRIECDALCNICQAAPCLLATQP